VPTKPGSCTLPIPGIQVAVVDETGHPVGAQHGGSLVIQRPFPSQIRTIWGDPDRFKKSYFPEEMRATTSLAIPPTATKTATSGSWGVTTMS